MNDNRNNPPLVTGPGGDFVKASGGKGLWELFLFTTAVAFIVILAALGYWHPSVVSFTALITYVLVKK